MIRTHVFIRCVGWVWRWLTKAQWVAMPKYVAVALVCSPDHPTPIPSYMPRPEHEGLGAPVPELVSPNGIDLRGVRFVPRFLGPVHNAPEPASLAVLGVALGGLVMARRRRRFQ